MGKITFYMGRKEIAIVEVSDGFKRIDGTNILQSLRDGLNNLGYTELGESLSGIFYNKNEQGSNLG